MQILQRGKLTRKKFAGVREYRLVFDERITRDQTRGDAWQGFGNFVYLADARVVPHGETGLQDHRGVDVISVVLEGCVRHEGSLQHGGTLNVCDVQVQCAGSDGFSHNQVNPNDTESRMLQLWLLPEQSHGTAAYRVLQPEQGRVTRVYGGAQAPAAGSGPTCIDIARLKGGQSLDVDKPALVYVCEGRGFANEDDVSEGCLLRCDQLTFDATQDTCLILVHQAR
jgi:quercetin 2,3-dioxygenase